MGVPEQIGDDLSGQPLPKQADLRAVHARAGSIGTATVTGYRIRFRRLSDIDLDVLLAAVGGGMALDQP